MKKLNLFLAILLLLVVVTTSCKKYKKGPLISLHSAEERVTGEWTVDYYNVDGRNELTTFDSIYSGYTLYVSKGGKYTIYTNAGLIEKGVWKFGSKKESIVYNTTDAAGNVNGTDDVENLIRLTQKEMWVKQETTINGQVTKKEIHYKLTPLNR